MPNLMGEVITAAEPDRECWHESGHGVTGYRLGTEIHAIGFEWLRGEDAEPNPTTWTIPCADGEYEAIHLFGGMAAELLKLKTFDHFARLPDVQRFNRLGCKCPSDHYLDQAMNLLKQNDAALVRVYEALMQRRVNPPRQRFKDSDGVWRQVHLTKEEFAALMD
jgi:hypothetical protein